MDAIGEKIHQCRKRLGWTRKKLSTLSEISESYLWRLETGKQVASMGMYQRLAGAMGMSLETLIPHGNVVPASIGVRKIPVLDYVQASRWTGADDRPDDEEMRETVYTDLEHPSNAFAMRITGDSMAPEFNEGDLVVVVPTVLPRPGDYVVASHSGEATFRKYRDLGISEKGDTVFELIPLNSLYPTLRSDRLPITIVGTMIEHRRYRRR